MYVMSNHDYIKQCIQHLVNSLDTIYYGCILSYLPIKESEEIPELTIHPDGGLIVNPDYPALVNRDTKRILRDLIHEAGHIAFDHFYRKEALQVKTNENHIAFNIAADCAIEHLFDEEFTYLPSDPVHHESLKQHIPREDWGKLSTEGMYGLLAKPQSNQDKQQQDSHIPILSPEGKALINSALQQAQKQAKDIIQEAAMQSASKNTAHGSDDTSGKVAGVSEKTKELLDLQNDDLVYSSLDVIEKLFKKTFGRGEDKDDSVFNQRNMLRREFNGSALMGRHQRLECEQDGDITKWHNDVTIYADVSGSMDTRAVLNGFKLIYRLAKQYGVEPVEVHTYNTSHQQTFIIDSNTDISKLKVKTGGGTNVNRVLEQKPPKSSLVFVLTDMEDRPVEKWDHDGKLVWLIHDNRKTDFPEFKIGQQICINDIIKG